MGGFCCPHTYVDKSPQVFALPFGALPDICICGHQHQSLFCPVSVLQMLFLLSKIRKREKKEFQEPVLQILKPLASPLHADKDPSMLEAFYHKLIEFSSK